ncbi:MAG: DUF3847 domain-containing protein, partial [Tetragenococcus koreensis]|nr:DUF3847 domain-containing protein [Tetragenococcus koreensis]
MMKLDIKKKEQELNRLKQQEQREKNKRRKERTHRLITKGALLEKYFEIADFNIDETKELLSNLQSIAKQ